MSKKVLYKNGVLNTETVFNLHEDVTKSPVLDPSIGGQNGFRHKIGGLDDKDAVIELHNDTKYLNTQVIPVLMQIPTGFEYFSGKKKIYEAMKHIFEVRPTSITGLKGSLTVNFVETDVNGAGEKYSQAVNVLRERTQVEFTWRDIVGRPIQKLLTTWIEYLIMDPDTKVPKLSMLPGYATRAWQTDLQTMTMLFIEMDVSHKYVDKAWLVTAMMPNTNGPVEGRRNLAEDAAPLDIVVQFTGTTDQSQATVNLAEKIIGTFSYLKSDSDFAPLAVTETDPSLSEATTGFDATTSGTKNVGAV